MNVWSRRLLAAALAALAVGLAGCVGDATDDDEGEILVARSPLTITPPPASKPEATSTGTRDPVVTVILDGADDGDPVDPDPNPWTPQLPSSPGSPGGEQTKK
jgi:hypothetical protein